MTVRCAIYTRTATEAVGDQGSNSIEAQRERAAAYIKNQRLRGWAIYSERYDDRGYSGHSLDRPALQRLLRDAKTGMFEMVVVSDIHRLTRSLPDLLRIVDVLDGADVSLATVTEELNTSSPWGRMTLNLLLSTCRHALREPS